MIKNQKCHPVSHADVNQGDNVNQDTKSTMSEKEPPVHQVPEEVLQNDLKFTDSPQADSSPLLEAKQ